MNPPGALRIVEGVEKIFDIYNHYNIDPEFSLTTNSLSLKAVSVLQALLRHAIAPSSVALQHWKRLQLHLSGIVEMHGDATNPSSLTLSPRRGEWTTVDAWVLNMSQAATEELVKDLSTYAHDWMTGLLLPMRSYRRTSGTIDSKDSSHQRVARFREEILEREGYICPVTLLKDEAGFDPESENEALITLEAAHILPFATGNKESLIWKYIEMFTSDTKIQNILQDINVVENGILLQHDVHIAFGNLKWGIETRVENGNSRYFIKQFRPTFFCRPGVRTGTELSFSRKSGHDPPNPDLCALHLAICAVASACGAAKVFDKLFEHDPDIVGPVAGEYTLPTDPISDRFIIPYFERRLFEENVYV